MSDRMCVVLVCNYEGDQEYVFEHLLTLQDDLKAHGAPTFLAFPSSVSHREWYTKLCLSGRGMETFRNTDGEAITESLKELYERKKPTSLCTCNLPPYPVEKAAAAYPQTRTYISIDQIRGVAENNLPRIISKFYDFLVFQYLGKKVHFISQSDYFVKKRPLNNRCIPAPLSENPELFSPEEIKAFREQNHVKDSEILVGCSASLKEERGMICAVEAVNKLVSVLSLPVKLLLYCKPHCGEAEIRRYLDEEEVRTENLLFSEPMPSYRLSSVCDIYLSPCMEDAFPSYALEMLSLGKRAVVSSIPGTEFLSKFSTVTTFEAGSADDCARALLSSIRSSAVPNQTIAAYIRRNFARGEWICAMRRVLLFL